jgi:hypothetical protein
MGLLSSWGWTSVFPIEAKKMPDPASPKAYRI